MVDEQKLKELSATITEFNATLEQLREQENVIDKFKVIVRTNLFNKYYKKIFKIL